MYNRSCDRKNQELNIISYFVSHPEIYLRMDTGQRKY